IVGELGVGLLLGRLLGLDAHRHARIGGLAELVAPGLRQFGHRYMLDHDRIHLTSPSSRPCCASIASITSITAPWRGLGNDLMRSRCRCSLGARPRLARALDLLV